MRTHSKRTYAAVVMAVMVVTARPVAAQSQSGGWPDAGGDGVKAPKAAVAAKPAPAVAPEPSRRLRQGRGGRAEAGGCTQEDSAEGCGRWSWP